MTTILSRLLAWLKGATLSFILILGVISAFNWVDHQKLEEQKERLNRALSEMTRTCDSKKLELSELIRAHPVAVRIPSTKQFTDAIVLKVAVEACEQGIAKINDEYQRLGETGGGLFSKYIEPNIPSALVAMFLMFAGPPLFKVFLYFLVAPIASRRRPLVIVSDANGSEYSSVTSEQQTQIGAVSQSVVLTPGQVLLVHSDYLQTTPLHAKKSTKWLLNNKVPLSSISSGMYMLTRLECSTSDPIVVSSTNDHLSEIGIVELPEGAAFVCQPRSLVGVIYGGDRPIQISKHWRFWSLQSWLTLQLRFMVFHGPGRLLIKGSRGIRMETAASARLLNQNATLGFSANLKYANARCETFISYLTGKDDLFHDLFAGSPGVYVYEEVAAPKPGGIASFAERIVNAVLNAFGI